MSSIKLLSIGFGNMSGAVVRAAVKNGVLSKKNVFVSSPSINTGVKTTEFNDMISNSIMPPHVDVILLGVKPKDMPSVCAKIAPAIEDSANNPLVLSIAAGFNVAPYFTRTPVVRVMPNIGVSENEGFTVLFPNKPLDPRHHKIVENLFGSTGMVKWLNTEADFHLYTALTGSGPGSVFRLMDAEIKAAVALASQGKKLSTEEYNDLYEEFRPAVVQTFLGAVSIAKKTGDKMEPLIGTIASKDGTTQRKINCFAEGGIDDLTYAALKAARDRSVELGAPPVKKPERGIVDPRFFSPKTPHTTSEEESDPALTNPYQP
jgi:pyrroline-5-carboxylate reductase